MFLFLLTLLNLLLKELFQKKTESDEKTLEIVCIGSLFKSWRLLRAGFLRGMTDIRHRSCRQVNLLKCNDNNNASFGAARLAARLSSLITIDATTTTTSTLTSCFDSILF